jgi:hypothetical protein
MISRNTWVYTWPLVHVLVKLDLITLGEYNEWESTLRVSMF